ncbi:MAG TPA: alpha-galactosidase [Candidatus Hydrogenedentes bacterium]|nr:alpha-galactosidase [Candidatus Hydrogenedentota bacterium]HQM49404.1 alpha-galactosidase [Candidatus Hydrogenedentota bacterium]
MTYLLIALTLAAPGESMATGAVASPEEIQDAVQWLDTYFGETPGDAWAFSFAHNGVPVTQLLPGWRRTCAQEAAVPGVARHTLVFSDAASGLELTYTALLYERHAAIELLLELRNTANEASPLLEQIRSLDCIFSMPPGPCTIHHALGEFNSERSFMPVDDPLDIEKAPSLVIAPRGGRSSDEHMPFFNAHWEGGGVVVAIGWAGQWETRFRCEEGNRLRVDCGMQKTRLRLHPGETIRTPRVLLEFWRGADALRGNNLFRQWMLAHNLPRRGGDLVLAPICGSVSEVDPDGSYEGPHVRAMQPLAERGVEIFWSDMDPQQWYPGGFPNGTGTWEPDPAKYPRGLRPIGEAAHAAGLEYLLWFEPERVAPGTRIEELHPEWLARGEPFHLFRLDIPEARDWLTDYIDKQITEADLDWVRWDFNIEPLGYWERTDEPEREGIAEIRHVDGLYAMWEELMRRHPGLVIDICASGGRRIDFETLRYGLPLWHSDLQCFGPHPAADQLQNGGLFRWLPLHGCGNFGLEPAYLFRSAMTTGNILTDSPAAPGAGKELAVQRTVAIYNKLRPFMLGDFYPLFAHLADESVWYGFQFHRPDLDAGFALLFRRENSPYLQAELSLKGLNAEKLYVVTYEDRPESEEVSGKALSAYPVSVPEAPGSAILYYRLK